LTDTEIRNEEERRRKARAILAQHLSDALQFALGTGLDVEAAVIAMLIESTLMNKGIDLYLKLHT
jgi:hypothetical protein